MSGRAQSVDRRRRGKTAGIAGAAALAPLCLPAALHHADGHAVLRLSVPPEVIALAVRRYLRFRLSHADVAELLAERGVRADPSTIFAWVREFAPLDEGAAHPFRRAVGSSRSVDEPHTKIAGAPVYVCRAIDGRGQVVDVYVIQRRATADAAAFFRRAV